MLEKDECNECNEFVEMVEEDDEYGTLYLICFTLFRREFE